MTTRPLLAGGPRRRPERRVAAAGGVAAAGAAGVAADGAGWGEPAAGRLRDRMTGSRQRPGRALPETACAPPPSSGGNSLDRCPARTDARGTPEHRGTAMTHDPTTPPAA